MAAREVQVIDYAVQGASQVITVSGEFRSAGDLKLAVQGRVGIPAHQLLLLLLRHGAVLLLDDAALPPPDHHGPAPELCLYRRLPDDELLLLTIHSPWDDPVECAFRAGARVRQLKDFLARRLCVAQWKQALEVFRTPVANDDDVLGTYAVVRRTDVFVSSPQRCTVEFLPPMLVITVRDGTTGRLVGMPVERRDTVEVLLGALEGAGMLKLNEPGRIFLGNEQLQPGHSFENFDIRETLVLVKGYQ